MVRRAKLTFTALLLAGMCFAAATVKHDEDLDEARMGAVLDALAAGQAPKPGPQIDRQTSCPEGGPTTLKKMAERNYDYRSLWTATAGEGAQ